MGEPAPGGATSQDATLAGGRSREATIRRGGIVAFTAYCVIQAGLLFAMVVLPYPASGAVCLTVATAGSAIFVLGVARRQPVPTLGWGLVAASALATLAAGFAVAVSDGLRESVAVSSPLPVGLGAMAFGLLAAGLAILGWRSTSGVETADRLDAAMAGAGALLLAWLFVTNPVGLAANGRQITGAILFPVAVLLVFVTATKIVLSYCWRPPAVVLVVLAVGVLLAAAVGVLLPAVHTATLTTDRSVQALWAAHGGLLGASALHPSFGRAALGSGPVGTDLSKWRILLFAVLAVLVPTVLAIDLVQRPTSFDRTATGVTVPTAAAAGLLLLLIGRLALIARVSQRRARVLARRSASLAASIAQKEALQRQLADRALRDPLTGLSNRMALAERLEQALRQQSGGPGHALLVLDLDGFKDINDTFGHPIGDQVLVDASDRLLMATPRDCVVARLGGDEFAVLLENAAEPQARVVAEKILDALRRPFDVAGQELFLSTSIGLFATGAHGEAVARVDVLRDADLALYAAKRAGKDRLVAFDPRLRTERLEHAAISAGLRRALSQDSEIQPHYQPIVNLATGDILAVEALARWNPPDGDCIPPKIFIPIAEETGLITAIGARILRQACQDARPWYHEQAVAISVNISGRQLDQPDFVDTVINALAATGLPGNALILELTEGSLVSTEPRNPRLIQLERLRANGVRIAIDNFGTGHSSLAYIARLPVDIVKLDKSFIQQQARDGSSGPNWAFTRAITQAIAALGLHAIAEGVETADQADALRTMRCPFAQGHHFARAEPAATINQILGVSTMTGEHHSPPGHPNPLSALRDRT